MSDTDSFIEEVTEEVRRDRLFLQFRRYGWIAALAVVAIVGAAAWNEWQKAQIRADAQATGDALLAAVQADDDASRVAALDGLQTASPQAQIVADFLLATHQLGNGQGDAAAETLDGLAGSGSEMPDIYRQIAAFKAVLARGTDMAVEDRRATLETLAAPGQPLALLAQEQLALLDVETGDAETAIGRLNGIVQDAGVTPGLRRRASQLIVALGGTPAELPTAVQTDQ